MVVYVIVNSETLKIYIGQHGREDDLKQYLAQKRHKATHYSEKSRSHLYNAMRKYPKDLWSIHPLVSGIEDKKELDETEQLLIYALKSQHPDVGYNICDGGEGYTGPGYWLGKKRPGFTVPKRPGWRNQSTFEKGSIPWNKDKPGSQVSPRKGKKMQYASEDIRRRVIQNLNWTGKKRKPFSAEHRAALSAAHRKVTC